jgi:GntR family transcriptional regulator
MTSPTRQNACANRPLCRSFPPRRALALRHQRGVVAGMMASKTSTLARRIADEIRERIMAGDFTGAGRLPSETSLAREYQVSRVTIRTALKSLEAQGLVDIRHGSGTYLMSFGPSLRSGLQELRSVSQVIRDLGQTPTYLVHARERRASTPQEADRLALDAGAEVLVLDRTFLADDVPVAHSLDIVPAHLVPPAADGSFGTGPLFTTLASVGIETVRAIAELHAVEPRDITWGVIGDHTKPFVLLDQVIFDRIGRRIVYNRVGFPEGRFQFVVLRTR